MFSNDFDSLIVCRPGHSRCNDYQNTLEITDEPDYLVALEFDASVGQRFNWDFPLLLVLR